MKLQIVVDSDYICHRAQHSIGHLSDKNDIRTGVMYGFLTTVRQLREEFGKARFIFCFDSRNSLRREIYPEYKANRRVDTSKLSDQEALEKKEYHRQVHLLRTSILEEIGFRNIRFADGYEADDHIAQACFNSGGRESIIITSDHDMYQCLGRDVSIWNLNKKMFYTLKHFEKEFGIKPSLWSSVKAIAGCASDNVRGVAGVGEKTAVKWFTGALKPGTKKYDAINANISLVSTNMPLVRLPYDGCPEIKSVRDEVTNESWKAVLKNLGMLSLRERKVVSDRHRMRHSNGTRQR